MPTTKRLRRHARQMRGIEQGSTRWQQLMWGTPIVPESGPAFESEAEMRAAWGVHRTALLAEHGQPGSRPAAYFHFDLEIVDHSGKWWEDLSVLLARDLISAEEAARIESLHHALRTEGHQSFDDEAAVREMDLGPSVLANLAGEFGAIARWHEWRRRPDIATAYMRREAIARRVLAADTTEGEAGSGDFE